jgi:phage-related protein
LVIFSLHFFAAYSQLSIPGGIYDALKEGNSKELVKYFNANVELVILDKEGVYNKAQSGIMLEDFFNKNVPHGFIKLHEGEEKGAKFIIGRLTTSRGTYRIVFLMKNSKLVFCIHQFRIEDDNF